MSEQILDPDLETPTDIDEQLKFFFSQFSLFIDEFKKVYKLKRIEKIINKVYHIVKTFIKNDFFKIPLNIKGKINEIEYLSKNNNQEFSSNDIQSTTADVLRMIKEANRLRNLSFAESMVSPTDTFLLNSKNKTLSKKKKKIQQCLKKLS